MLARHTWPILTSLALALPVSGADLSLSLAGSVEYDSNVFRSENNREEDGVFRGVPRLILRESGEELEYQVMYSVPYSRGFTESDIDDFDHIASARASFSVTDRLRVYGSERFTYRRFLRRSFENDGGDRGDSSEINNNRERVTRNDASLGFSYQLDPRLSAIVDARHTFYSSTRRNRATNWSIRTSAQLQYALTPRHRLGGGPTFTYQTFEEEGPRESQDTRTYGIRGSWRWIVDDATTLSVSLVPSLFDTEQGDTSTSVVDTFFPDTRRVVGGAFVSAFVNCASIEGDRVVLENRCGDPNFFVPEGTAAFDQVTGSSNTVERAEGASDTTFALLGEVELTRRWTSTFTTRAGYVRRQSAASGLGGTTILDVVNLSADWTPFERWEFNLRGDWSQRQSVAESTQSLPEAVEVPQLAGGLDFGTPVAAYSGGRISRTTDNEVDTQRWGIGARIGHRLARRTRLSLRFTYDKQSSKSRTSGTTSDFENYTAILGVRHEFEPIQLW